MNHEAKGQRDILEILKKVDLNDVKNTDFAEAKNRIWKEQNEHYMRIAALQRAIDEINMITHPYGCGGPKPARSDDAGHISLFESEKSSDDLADFDDDHIMKFQSIIE